MKKNVTHGFFLAIGVLLIVFFFSSSFNVWAQTDVDTRVGIGFDESYSTEPTQDSSFNPFPDPTTKKPPIKTGRLPQTGEFIEPMIVVLLGLLIWLVVLSLIAVRRYLRKEGDS